jgi:dTDP-4-dehydrorhamnose 3,5-epimerase-like enzyme
MNNHKFQVVQLSSHMDSRGTLTSIEELKDIPFSIKRVFYMHNIVSDRGGHAHIDTDQVIIAIHGSYNITVDNGSEKKTIFMNNPEVGLYLPRLTFTDFSDISEDAVILVLASTHYDMSQSLRNYGDFQAYLKIQRDEKNNKFK